MIRVEVTKNAFVWVFKALIRAFRRFINNTPRNEYEAIIFSAIRAASFRFGQERNATS